MPLTKATNDDLLHQTAKLGNKTQKMSQDGLFPAATQPKGVKFFDEVSVSKHP